MTRARINKHMLRNIIKITLMPMWMWSQDIEELLMMTSAHESSLGLYEHEIKGVALGIYQMNPSTHADLWDRVLAKPKYKNLKKRLIDTTGCGSRSIYHLQYDPVYATAMARIYYMMREDDRDMSIPNGEDHWAMAKTCKEHWNTFKGAATTLNYFDAYQKLVA